MGLFSTSRTGFDPAKDLPDLTGKVVIVTGGNSGIGFATVQHLARRGAKVYIGARNEARVKAAVERLHAQGLQPGNGTVDWFQLDLGDPRTAKKSAQSFLEKETRLDVLVNNAGVLTDAYNKNGDGVIEAMVVNHFSTYVFTNELLPLLKQTAKEPESDVRVVFASSGTMKMLKGRETHFRNIDDLNEKFGSAGPVAPMYRYAKSKLAGALYAKHLQRTLDAEGTPITVLSIHPGSVYTEGVEKDPNLQLPLIGSITKVVLRRLFDTPAVGASSTVFAAASPIVKAERDNYKGAFVWPPGNLGKPPAPQVESKELAEELVTTTETLLKQWGV